MPMLSRALRVFMFIAASCLVANDVARLLFPPIQQSLVAQICDEERQDENNSSSAFSFFEEEVKHHDGKHNAHLLLPEDALDDAIAHLIKDDDVRHLAYIPIFSPPPNLA